MDKIQEQNNVKNKEKITLGKKLKTIRKKFGLSQEDLAGILNVSRQAITKWENDVGLPDTDNLKELSIVFGITIDYLLNEDNELPLLVMRINLDKTKYKNKLRSYDMILKEYYPEPWEKYVLLKERKLGRLEKILDLFMTAGDYSLILDASDLSPYYLVKKDNLKLLVNIKDWVLEVTELSEDINEKKFVVGKNKFTKQNEIKL